MAIIKQYHKDTDTTYFYESVSYWDAEKGQSRSKRKCIGKLDPATGEMVPTGKRGRKNKEDTAPADGEELVRVTALYEQSRKELSDLRLKTTELEKRIRELTGQNRELRALLSKIRDLAQNA